MVASPEEYEMLNISFVWLNTKNAGHLTSCAVNVRMQIGVESMAFK